MQTFNNAPKQKDVQTTSSKLINAECLVTEAIIFDDYTKEEEEQEDGNNGNNLGQMDIMGGFNTKEKRLQSTTEFSASNGAIRSSVHNSSMLASGIAVDKILSQSMAQGGSVSEVNTSSVTTIGTATNTEMAGDNKDQDKSQTPTTIIVSLDKLNQDNLKSSLLIMERAIVGNNYYSRLLEYRDVLSKPEFVEENFESEENSNNEIDMHPNVRTIQFLWSYRCDLVRGRSVNAMAWNKKQKDILAVAYGESKNNVKSSSGLVLCWSVKNPEWPEKIYECDSSVTSIDFSKSNPNLLAVGLFNGVINLYDVCRKKNSPILQNSDDPDKHHDPIWELKWIEKERVAGDEHSKSEFLVSVSTDGRVCQWVIHKGMEHNDLMLLKRVTNQDENKNGKAGKSSFISRFVGGLCFDFNPKDNNTYLVGTEDGYIHRCSGSYNEQYLASYAAHSNPVYRVKWSPFLSNAFSSSISFP
jgi:hypothetical protein